MVAGGGAGVFDNANYIGYGAIVRNGAVNLGGAALTARNVSPSGNAVSSISIQNLDSPNTTSPTTYSFYLQSSSGNTVYANFAGVTTLTITAMEVP